MPATRVLRMPYACGVAGGTVITTWPTGCKRTGEEGPSSSVSALDGPSASVVA
ncbi:hypothetical protein JL475_35695 [Streptomyces sp. M2CJ-2]|uniref:hypothetical protein n=1 Tax=Streptomyces sp. M2CJ-2 TaxID=2803948 RepID=UPI0019272252|nr:hypothetical protein [Streptomyces sp. M2CJ-2]MBL3671178.1 hypothetical protein [Streptomyces sp. M2CJ-2]